MNEENQRREWMGILARAPAPRIKALWDGLAVHPEYSWLRRPEIGGVMVRGRMGGTGAPFNLGEMTVTRCSIRLACGTAGHGYVQGRDQQQAEIAALCDALMQTDGAGKVKDGILTPLAHEMAEARKDDAAKAAATKVDFFTLVRGED